MSALGHKQTFALQWAMSALPPKADMCGAARDVRFGPIADIGTTRSVSRLITHYSTVRLKLSVAVCAPGVVESVTITVKVTVPLWVGVPDNTPVLGDNAIPFVISGHYDRRAPCPLYPRKRIFALHSPMSAMGQSGHSLIYSITSRWRAATAAP